jgi:hypothetical protein
LSIDFSKVPLKTLFFNGTLSFGRVSPIMSSGTLDYRGGSPQFGRLFKAVHAARRGSAEGYPLAKFTSANGKR